MTTPISACRFPAATFAARLGNATRDIFARFALREPADALKAFLMTQDDASELRPAPGWFFRAVR